MMVAIVGSRSLRLSDDQIAPHVPNGVTGIVSGGASGVDQDAARYAKARGIPLREFLPDYERYGRRAPLVRNKLIVKEADYLIAFWDGHSRGTMHTAGLASNKGIPFQVVRLPEGGK